MRTLARKQKAPRQRRGFGLIRPSAAEPAVGRIDEEPKPYLATTASTRFAHDFSRIPVHSNVRGNVQAKLTVNTPGDIYEQEADRIAEKVMRMARPQLQRACADTGECLADRAGRVSHGQQRLRVPRLHASGLGQNMAPHIVYEVISSPGHPLDSSARRFMESRFGHDFSHVRIHSDPRGEMSAAAINAQAYTSGTHIVFGKGQYAPLTRTGLGLLAHELTHVLQQSAGPARTAPVVQRQVPRTPSPEDWDFTPADLDDLHRRGGVLHFGPDSGWLPERVRTTLLSALDQMLSTVRHVGIPATLGVNVMDLFHCHIVVPARLRVAASTPDRQQLIGALQTEERQTQQQFQNADITDANRAAFRRRLEAEQQAAAPLLESVLQMPEAGIVFHSFEGNRPGPSTSPQRNWFANFQTMTARPFEALPGESGFSDQWSSFMSFDFLIDANGMIHVRSGSSGIQALSDVTGRSEGGVAGLGREIEGLDQPSFAEQAFRRDEARQAARRRAATGPVEQGIGRAFTSGTVYVDSATNPSAWSHALSRNTPDPANSFHEPQRPPNFILVRGGRFNLNRDGSVTPRAASSEPANALPRGATPAP